MLKEVWKDVVGYEGIYFVSNIGNVKRRRKRCALKSTINKYGYSLVVLSVNCKAKAITTHRLVAMAFIDNPENKKEVNHINGIKTDNRVDNLEWATREENMSHAVNSGLINYDKLRGENNYNCKLSEAQARDIKFNCKKDMNTKKIFAAKHGVPIHIVNDILRGRSWEWLI